jgi:hypothetical protein
MNTKLTDAVERLNKILPLAKSRQSLSRELSDTFQNIHSSHVHLGKTLNRNEIARQVTTLISPFMTKQAA